MRFLGISVTRVSWGGDVTLSTTQVPTLERIRTAATDLMFERGYHGTSLRDIAHAVGVQTASLYYHFPSKQSVLMDIMTRTMDGLITGARTAMAGLDTPGERLVAGIRHHVLFHADNRKAAHICDTEVRALEPIERAQVVAWRDEYSGMLRSAIVDGQREGIFRQAHPSVVVSALGTMLSFVPTWYDPNGPLKVDEIADIIVEVFVNGLQA